MRTNVTFQHPAKFVPLSGADGILSVGGARWLVLLLCQVAGLRVDDELCQEDWGVVLFASHDGKPFWVGLSAWPDQEEGWLVHFHHHHNAWIQRFSKAGRAALERLVAEFHAVPASDPQVSAIAWCEDCEIRRAEAHGASTPSKG